MTCSSQSSPLKIVSEAVYQLYGKLYKIILWCVLNRVLCIYLFDALEFIYYLSFYCFGQFSLLMETLEASVLLDSFDHPEFLISASLWSVYS